MIILKTSFMKYFVEKLINFKLFYIKDGIAIKLDTPRRATTTSKKVQSGMLPAPMGPGASQIKPL